MSRGEDGTTETGRDSYGSADMTQVRKIFHESIDLENAIALKHMLARLL